MVVFDFDFVVVAATAAINAAEEAFGVFTGLGLTGKVEKGPSCSVRFAGGRPRGLPDCEPLRQAAETAEPCFLRGVDGVALWECADRGVSRTEEAARGLRAE